MKKIFITLFILLVFTSLVACSKEKKVNDETANADVANERQTNNSMEEILVVGKTGPEIEDFIFEPAEINLKVGEKVKLTLTSDDEIQHGLRVGGKVIQHGESIEISFEKPGEYFGNCSELCGAGHALMALKIIVE
ncbi:hypothetical protein ACFYKX_00940 [Cytobacillus sp. FJAT-54145]|uniref:Cytochrome oxidase subunit II copper A binding domain-containing protein n=1 Tax=Cytobacillus spartinae TaxID=3299023 RepID=A0ABW6K4S9_9BACI